MSTKLTISLSPHEKGKFTVKNIMWGVIIALVPSFISSVYYFGIRAVIILLVSMLTCMGFEYFIQKFVTKEKVTAFDGSAAITGVLLAFNVPSSIPLWQLVAGGIFAMGIGKLVFGGLGKNPFNPALIGRAFMLASFPADMTTWPKPSPLLTGAADAVTAATPLGILAEKGAAAVSSISYLDLFVGNIGGCIGEVSALAILIGGLFMLYKKIITWHIPVSYLGAMVVLSGILWIVDPTKNATPLFHILAGGAMLGAWFMATDMVTSPMTPKGMIIFGIGGGIIAVLIRAYGSYPEGVSYSILIMNAFVPLINKVSKPKRFGKEVNYV